MFILLLVPGLSLSCDDLGAVPIMHILLVVQGMSLSYDDLGAVPIMHILPGDDQDCPNQGSWCCVDGVYTITSRTVPITLESIVVH